jgi:putative transposase
LKIAYKYRLYPSKIQIQKIEEQFYEARKLYNAALEQRINSYRSVNRKSLNYYHQAGELKELRSEGFCKLANYSACQDVLKRLNKSFDNFFRRIKQGQTPGFPRFKGKNKFDTITFPSYGDGCKLTDKRIYLQGIGKIKIRLHRDIEGIIKTASLNQKNGKYYIIFSCDTEFVPLPRTNNAIGIDVGVESFCVTSDAEFVENPRFFKKSQKKLRVLQRSVSRKKKGSNCRKKAVKVLTKQHEKIQNQRKDFLHKLSNRFIKENDVICIENLNIKAISKGFLAKQIHDVSWAMFFSFLKYKAEKAGKEIIEVNPNGTSQRCHNCGTIVKKDLSVRVHHCPVCKINIHRDFNSALNILKLGTNLDNQTYASRQSVLSEAV